MAPKGDGAIRNPPRHCEGGAPKPVSSASMSKLHNKLQIDYPWVLTCNSIVYWFLKGKAE